MPLDTPLTILLVGNGGREHALAWKLAQSPSVAHIYAVPGNGGTAGLDKVTNVESVKAEDFAALVGFAKENGNHRLSQMNTANFTKIYNLFIIRVNLGASVIK